MRCTRTYAEIPKLNTKSPCVVPTREIALFLSWINMKSWIINGTCCFVRRLLSPPFAHEAAKTSETSARR